MNNTLRTLLGLSLGITLHISAANAAVLTETFTDGNKAGGADNSGILWYDRSANTALSIVPDTEIGSGNALRLQLNNTSSFNRGLMGVLDGVVFNLVNPGDTINLTFDFRFVSTSISAGGFTTSPGSSASGFTFGLYNSNGTISTDDSQTTQDDDFGFRADFGSGTTSSIFIGKETNSGTAGGTGTGTGPTDTLAVGLNPGSVPVNINDFLKHSGQFRLTKSAAGVDILVGFDGATVATGTSTVPFTSFDEIMFSQGSGSNFHIDNVVLTVTAVPEPSSMLLVASGVGYLGWRIRRRWKIV